MCVSMRGIALKTSLVCAVALAIATPAYAGVSVGIGIGVPGPAPGYWGGGRWCYWYPDDCGYFEDPHYGYYGPAYEYYVPGYYYGYGPWGDHGWYRDRFGWRRYWR